MTEQMRTCVKCKRPVFRADARRFWRHGVEYGAQNRTWCPEGLLHQVTR